MTDVTRLERHPISVEEFLMTPPFDQPCARKSLEARLTEPTSPCPESRRPFVLAAAILGSSMVFIDGTALTVALPAIRDGLNASPSALNWIVNAYVLALAAFTLIGGAAADRFGRRRVFLLGAIGFALASVACGLARDDMLLISARAVQGLFGAALAPASLALIAAAYPKGERASAIGAWAGASALTTAAGPVIGGLLVDSLHWSAIFFMNVPVAAGAVWLAWRFSPETSDAKQAGPFDVAGAILIALSLGALAYGLVGLGEGAASRLEAIGALVAGSVLFVGFVLREHRASAPMAPPSLFAIPALAGANGFTLLAYVGLGSALFVLPLVLADQRGWTATQIGAAFLPFTLAVGFLSGPAGRLAQRFGARWVMTAGAGLAAAGFLALQSSIGDGAAWLSVLAPMMLIGIGFAAFIPALTDIAVSSAPAELEGVASGVNNAVARVAQLIGVAVAAAVLQADAPQAAFLLATGAALAGAAIALATASRRS
ncbi:MAG: MFS transporter [Pseudomonadota bacterium]